MPSSVSSTAKGPERFTQPGDLDESGKARFPLARHVVGHGTIVYDLLQCFNNFAGPGRPGCKTASGAGGQEWEHGREAGEHHRSIG